MEPRRASTSATCSGRLALLLLASPAAAAMALARTRSGLVLARAAAPAAATTPRPAARARMQMVATAPTPTPTVFETAVATADAATLKQQILQLGASLDRGQSYNPTSGAYYAERMAAARERIEALVRLAPPAPTSLAQMDGEWELVLATVPNGIFRSSPFFLAIEDAYVKHAPAGEPTGVDKLGFFLGARDNSGRAKADLFFKLHELQVCSWGASKVRSAPSPFPPPRARARCGRRQRAPSRARARRGSPRAPHGRLGVWRSR